MATKTGRRPKLSARQQEVIRQKIDGAKLIHMMTCYLEGEKFNFGNGRGLLLVDWNATQARMAMDLLNKIVPGLRTVEADPATQEGGRKQVKDKPIKTQQKEWLKKHKNVVGLDGNTP